jgi:hypothetical protein
MSPAEQRGRGRPDGSATRPAGMCHGPGHLVVYGNEAFHALFGKRCVGLPAREGLLGLPAAGFDVLDAAYGRGRAVARWIRLRDADWRMTAAPMADPETHEVYGVRFHLRRRDDTPVVLPR